MRKHTTFCLISFTVLFNFYNTAYAWKDVCELAAAMEENGVSATVDSHLDESLTGQGLLKDVENKDFNPSTYCIHVSCELEKIANIMVYVEAGYDRMRRVGNQVSFEGKLRESGGWKEFVGSREPYIQLTLGSGRVSWAD